MPGSGIIATCPCGYHPNGLVCGAAAEWHYEQWACQNCCTLKSLQVPYHKKFKRNCPSCKKPRYRITDLQYWTPDTLKEKIGEGGDPWNMEKSSINEPDIAIEAEKIRYFCPNCQQFQLKIETGRFLWD